MSPHELLTDRCHVSLHLAVESAALAVERLRHRTRVAACPRDPRGAAIAAIADASDLSAIAYELPASCHDDRPDAMCGYVELPLDLTTVRLPLPMSSSLTNAGIRVSFLLFPFGV